MPRNSNLHDSSLNKQDESYTNLLLIDGELSGFMIGCHFPPEVDVSKLKFAAAPVLVKF